MLVIKAIIWDLGGVLLRTTDQAPRMELAKKFDMTSEQLESLVFHSESSKQAERGEKSLAEHWVWLSEILDCSVESMAAFQEEFFGGDCFDGDLLSWIQSMRSFCKMGLLSNAWANAPYQADQKYPGFSALFDAAAYSVDIKVRKPDPASYQWVVSKLQVHPAECVFVDDMPMNLEGAASVGIQPVHYKTTPQVIQDLSALLSQGGAVKND